MNAHVAPSAGLKTVLEHLQAARFDAAERMLRDALTQRPNNAVTLHYLGFTLVQTGRTGDGLVFLRKALAGHGLTTVIKLNTAKLFIELDNAEEAVAPLHAVITDEPKNIEAIALLARCHSKLGRAGDHHAAVGLMHYHRREPERAVEQYRLALEHTPDNAHAHFNLATASHRLAYQSGYAAQALHHYEEALRLQTEFPRCKKNRGNLRLLRGDLRGGFADLESRQRFPPHSHDREKFSGKPWQGQPLDGRRLLVCSEQGFGDAIQFVRYLRDLKAASNRIELYVEAPLVSLFQRLPWVDAVTSKSEAVPVHDYHVSIMSLAHLVGTTLENIPADTPYLFAQSRPKLASDGLNVGVVWAGRPGHHDDAVRSIAFADFEPLLKTADINFYNLQLKPPDVSAEELEARGIRLNSNDAFRTFDDSARLVAALDLVITVDTAPAHLAGALGVPVWILLPIMPDWRWMLDSSCTPWYPSATLFRQATPGDWPSVISRVGDALEQRRNQHRDGPSVAGLDDPSRQGNLGAQ